MTQQNSQIIIASDLEGTLTTGETWRGIRAYLEAHGHKRDFQWFFFTQLPSFFLSKMGLLPKREFQNLWTARVMQLFAGLTETEFTGIAEWIAKHQVLPNMRQNVINELIQAKAADARVIIVSGTYEPVLKAVAAHYGFEVVGTPLEIINDKLTGKIIGAINVGNTKRQRLETYLAGNTLSKAYGDTMPDIPMLELAQEAIVASGDTELEEIAKQRGWRVID